MRAAPREDRRARLLAEARALIAGGGLAAVTHRAVETAAGVPHGSVTYYFGSRDGLVLALVDDMVDECEAMVAGIARQAAAAADIEGIARAIAAWMDDDVEMHLARMELELAAARDPRLQERMTDAARVFWRLCEPIAAAAGSDDPERDGRAMAAMVDGLLLDRLAHPGQSHELLAGALRRLLATPPA
jgi:AcrR family transcriptional regulator